MKKAIIPDFSRLRSRQKKSAPSLPRHSGASEGPHSQIRREFGWLCGVSQILPALKHMHKIVLRKIRDTLRNRQNPRRILSCNPFGANFALTAKGGQAKFGIIWLKAARLKLHILGMLPVLIGSLIALNKTGSLKFANLMLAELITLFTLIATAFANDYADAETDRLNRGYNMFSGGSRLIVDGFVSRRQMLIAAQTASFISIVLSAVFLIVLKGHPIVLTFNLAGLFIGLEYSVSPLRINYRGLGEFFVTMMYSVFCVAFGYITQVGPGFDIKIFYYSIPIAIVIFLVILITQVPDYESDRLSGKKNIPAVFGKEASLSIFLTGIILLYAAVAILYLLGPLTKFTLVGLFFSLPLGICAARLSVGSQKASAKTVAALCGITIFLNVWVDAVIALNLALGH